METGLDFIKDTLYQLKEEYPLSVDVYHVVSTSVNVETGKQTTVRDVKRIYKAILLPSALLRAFTYDLAFISANKNFTTGGYYDIANKTIIIDRDDLDDDLVLDDYLVIRGSKYKMVQIEFLEEIASYIIAAKELKGEPVDEIYEESIISILSLASVANL